jgi:hypothetical protein
MKKETKIILFSSLLILLVALFLYFKTLVVDLPLGLDAIGHISKVRYLQEFGLVNWNHSWYSGTSFLKFYSPLQYLLASLFSNPIFGVNFLGFLSIFLTSLGIYFLVREYSPGVWAFISGISFLTVLAVSYYFIAVGNHPYIFALWTLPFSLFFLEKSLKNKSFYPFFIITASLSIISHLFLGVFLFFICAIRFLFLNTNIIKRLKILCIYLIPAGLLSAWWWVGFLSKSSSFAGGSPGYIAHPFHLLGFGKYIIWGRSPGEIGILFVLFLVSLIIYFRYLKNFKKDNYLKFIFVICLFSFFCLVGGLGNFYPFGVGAIRFILPFSILSSIFIGLVLPKFKRKIILLLVGVLLLIGLFWNFYLINLNLENNSYNDENSRYGFLKDLHENNKLPFSDTFENYRFGTSHYIFGEPITYFYPYLSQTFGYYDQGILSPEMKHLMYNSIWKGNDSNSTFYFLDWYAIKYFEFENYSKYNPKFTKEKFNIYLEEDFYDYPFTIYEYLDFKPITSYIKTNIYSVNSIDVDLIKDMAEKNIGIEEKIPIESSENITLSFSYEELSSETFRDSPDKIEIRYNYLEGAVVLIKESFHKSWNAKDVKSNRALKIYPAGPKMMLVIPEKDSEGIVLSQSKTYFGLILTFIGIILMIYFYIFSLNFPRFN